MVTIDGGHHTKFHTLNLVAWLSVISVYGYCCIGVSASKSEGITTTEIVAIQFSVQLQVHHHKD